MELRNPQLKKHPVDKKTRELYRGFTNDTMNIIGKIVVRIQSNGWIADETPFFYNFWAWEEYLGKWSFTTNRNRNSPTTAFTTRQQRNTPGFG